MADSLHCSCHVCASVRVCLLLFAKQPEALLLHQSVIVLWQVEHIRKAEMCECGCRLVRFWVLLLLLPGEVRHVGLHADILLLLLHVHGVLCLLPHAGRCGLPLLSQLCTAYLQVRLWRLTLIS